MKTIKKIGFGLGLIAALSLFSLFLIPRSAAAATISNSDFANGQYNIVSFQNGKPKVIEAVIAGTNYTFTDRDTTDNTMNFKTPDNVGLICSQIINGWSNDLGINLSGSPIKAPGGGSYYTGYITLNYSGNTSTKCNDNNAQKFLPKTNIAAIFNVNDTISDNPTTGTPTTAVKGTVCTGGADCVNGSCSKSGGDCVNQQDESSSCESNFNSGFEWMICGALKMADAAAGAFSNFVDDQLCFSTGPNSSTNGVVCGGNDNLNDNVKTAWGIFKNIATALLVIVMLVMVFSQAFGGGPFDAYTVRKMLPKLVAAVIIMQLSWVLFKWAIDISNDLGKGIQDLLYAPFGGSSNMHLDKLVANVAQTHTTGTNDTWAFFTVMAGGVAAIANLPGLLTLALFAVVALATAFFVLILRKILIILLIILAPIALIAWILPGTQRYWKMWQENFTKLLLMFPMIMALIAGGRIFAYIVSGGSQPASTSYLPHLAVAHFGGLPVPYVASVTSFADIAIIVFAYFGPYLLLPKAFSWGGQFMGAAANQVNSRINKPAMEKGQQGIKGVTERYQGRFGKAYDPNAFIGKRMLNRIGSGHFIPTKRSQRLAIAAGDKFSQEKDEQALATIKRRGEKVLAEGYKTFRRDEEGNILSESRIRRDATTGQYLDKYGVVTDDINKAREIATSTDDYAVKPLTGVAAMKQMWVDLAEEGDANERKMAVRQLIATSSWPEIQSSYTKSGVRVIDTEAWAPSVTTSPEDYPKVLRSRVDATPHIEDSANKALKDQLEKDRLAGNPTMTRAQQLNFKSRHRIQYAIENQLDNEGFQTQSDGFWEEAGRMAEVKPGMTPEDIRRATEIQTALKARFQAIHDIGGTAPQQMLGHFKNGGSLQRNVEKALGGESLDSYLEPKR